MPYKDPEEKKAYAKAYREKNKEKKNAYNKAYREATREKAKANAKVYYEKNKEKRNAYMNDYRQTPKGKKSNRINGWRHKGIISNDWDALYERYINTTNCENCDVELTEDKTTTTTTRNLDHDHDITDRENVRNILCWSCNILRG